MIYNWLTNRRKGIHLLADNNYINKQQNNDRKLPIAYTRLRGTR